MKQMKSLANVEHLTTNIARGKMAPLLLFSLGDVHLTRLVGFHVQLVLGCSGLNADTASFHICAGRTRDPTCSLCSMNAIEDTTHFILDCPALQRVYDYWLSGEGCG